MEALVVVNAIIARLVGLHEINDAEDVAEWGYVKEDAGTWVDFDLNPPTTYSLMAEPSMFMR
jgi:hypothetical protein